MYPDEKAHRLNAPTRPREILLWLASAVCIAALDRLAGGRLSPLLALPVAFAAWRTGWTGGLAVAMLSTAFLASAPWMPRLQAAIQGSSLVCIGTALGVAAERHRRERQNAGPASGPEGASIDKALANLEGMKRAERLSALGQLSAGLAHEIRNPLASISGAAAILQRERELDPKQSKCVRIIISECQRLDGLLSNFLNFARPRPPRFQMVDLHPIFENTLALAGHAVRGKTVHLEMKIGSPSPRVECDPEQLEQVLLNLMLNAIEASPEGGTVTIEALFDSSSVTINVTDLGHGVATAHVDRLFDPFFTTKEHGTGLGLPVAHQIVRQMGGSLLANRNTGPGMTFSITLPAGRTEL
jgi:two-component system, NtrC family, sensor histidine kinase HydH